MTIWLSAWAGDSTSTIQGREYYTALISMTSSDGNVPPALIRTSTDDYGRVHYPGISANCMTPGQVGAIITGLKWFGIGAFSLSLAPASEPGAAMWSPGVHLFAIQMNGSDEGSDQAATIASVIVPSGLSKIVEPAHQKAFTPIT
jgi:hypothetical protein